MAYKAGNRIVLTTKIKRMAPRERRGTIERVLNAEQPRFEVRWDDGRLSTIAPLPDAFRVEGPPKKGKAAAKKKEEPFEQVTPTRQRLKASPRRTKVRKT